MDSLLLASFTLLVFIWATIVFPLIVTLQLPSLQTSKETSKTIVKKVLLILTWPIGPYCWVFTRQANSKHRLGGVISLALVCLTVYFWNLNLQRTNQNTLQQIRWLQKITRSTNLTTLHPEQRKELTASLQTLETEARDLAWYQVQAKLTYIALGLSYSRFLTDSVISQQEFTLWMKRFKKRKTIDFSHAYSLLMKKDP